MIEIILSIVSLLLICGAAAYFVAKYVAATNRRIAELQNATSSLAARNAQLAAEISGPLPVKASDRGAGEGADDKGDVPAPPRAIKERLATAETSLARAQRRMDSYFLKLNGVNSVNYQVHGRLLARSTAAKMVAGLSGPLKYTFPSQEFVAYLAHKICMLEDRCVGRLGTSIETSVLRALVARSLCKPGQSIDIIEIGTLFGVAAGAVHFGCRDICENVNLTLIDPLFGYYGKGEPDMVTGVHVNSRNLLDNMRRMEVPQDHLTLINDLSESPATLARLKDANYDVVIIDGDHTYDGVKRDFINYAPKLRTGGMILFDDYDVVAWPDVKTFVDEHMPSRKDFEHVFTGWRTSVYRKI